MSREIKFEYVTMARPKICNRRVAFRLPRIDSPQVIFIDGNNVERLDMITRRDQREGYLREIGFFGLASPK